MEKYITVVGKKTTAGTGNVNSISIGKRKADVDSNNNESSKHVRYEKNKRVRGYIQSWEEKWPWLKYNEDKMFCIYCMEFPSIANPAHSKKTNTFIDGCTHFRVESMKAHQVSEPHLLCTAYYRNKHEQPGPCIPDTVTETPLMSSIKKLNNLQREKFSALINIAYKIAKYGKPFTDFEIDCQLIEKLGVDLGKNYLNANRCKDFIKAISDSMSDAVKIDLQKSNFVSILADGTTDVSNLEQENVCVRYISPSSKSPVTMLAGIVDLEHGHADGVIDGIFKALALVGLSRETLKSTESGPSLVCLNFDGASVMQGKKNGVAGKLMRDYPHVIPVWCIAHKLQLSVMDAVKDVDVLQRLEATLKGIYKYYHGSPKRRREVKAVADVLEADLAHIPDLKEVLPFQNI